MTGIRNDAHNKKKCLTSLGLIHLIESILFDDDLEGSLYCISGAKMGASCRWILASCKWWLGYL